MAFDNTHTWTILIVDDDEDEYLLIQEALELIPNARVETVWIYNPDHALDEMLNTTYSAILLDYHLGLESGLSLLRKATAHNCSSPIIMVTGQDDVYTDRLAMQAGADDFFPKSQLNPVLLERSIRYGIERHRDRYLLKQAHAALATRLTELQQTNAQLKREIAKREEAQSSLATSTRLLKMKNKELDQFASIVSHDLQEPLRMITSYLTLLAKRNESLLDDSSKLYMQYAVDGAARMKRLIRDLLTYSRLASRSQPARTTDLNQILQEVKANLQIQLEECGGVIQADPLPNIQADATQMTQLLQNLIGNAIKFRSDSPLEIRITAKKQPTRWLFAVCDNGIGIPDKHAKEIFSVFRRLHSRTEYQGTGIGLAICHKIIEQHRGKIWLDTAVSQGACFKFTLPHSISR